eukprot:gene2497-12227_t
MASTQVNEKQLCTTPVPQRKRASPNEKAGFPPTKN